MTTFNSHNKSLKLSLCYKIKKKGKLPPSDLFRGIFIAIFIIPHEPLSMLIIQTI